MAFKMVFQNYLRPRALDESSLSIRRAKVHVILNPKSVMRLRSQKDIQQASVIAKRNIYTFNAETTFV